MRITAKTRTGVILTAIFLCVCAAVLRADQGQSSLRPAQSHQGPAEKTGMDAGTALYRMILAMSIVAVLGIAALYASKKVLPRFANTQGKRIKILETISLGPRKMVHLLEIGGQQILIGSTPDRITKLTDVVDVVFEKDAPLKQSHS